MTNYMNSVGLKGKAGQRFLWHMNEKIKNEDILRIFMC